MGVQINLLGGFSVTVDGRGIPETAWSRRSAAALVKLLALRSGRRLPREQLIDLLWPDLLVDEAAPRLHKAAHFARAALGVPDSVVLAGDVVALLPEAEVTVDVDQFDAAATAYLAGGGLPRADEAIRLYRGDLLPEDLYVEWTEHERDRRRLRYLELLKEAGRWDEVLAADPLDEGAHLRLVEGHVAAGDRDSALRQLDFMEQVWRRELDDEPGGAAATLRTEVLAMPAYDADDRPGGAGPTTPVPWPATDTIGREREIAEVLEALELSQVVTLVGPGGVGKTRLAQEVAHRYADATSGQISFVDLTKAREPGLVAEVVARGLGVQVAAGNSAEPALAEALHGRSLLIVLDNFEHVIDAAPVVGQILQRAPGVQVLATSRALLRIAGELVMDVHPLAVDGDPGSGSRSDAVTLFEQLALRIDPSFSLERSLDDVVAICQAVDGLPLAIEMATGHLRTLPPALLRTRLSERLGSSVGAARDAPERQQTISATIDWSLQLLADEEQQLFRRLGVFNGPAALDAIEQVCDGGFVDVVDPLTRLVEQSLVRRVVNSRHEPRYVLLELVRERARDLLTDELDTFAARHATYVVDFLEDLDERRWTEAADHWLDDITEVLGEVRAAHRWAQEHGRDDLAARITASLGTYWHLDGHHAEGRRWVEQALASSVDLDESTRAGLHLAGGFVMWPVDQMEARTHWQLAVEKYRGVGDTRMLAYALPKAAIGYLGIEDKFDLAMELCDEGVELSRQIGDRPLIAPALNVRGELTRIAGRDDLARAAYEEGRDLSIAAGDDAHLSVFLANLSYIAEHEGDYAEAQRLARESLRLAWSQGRRLMSAWTVDKLAGSELWLGRPERGALLIGASDKALRLLGVGLHPGDVPEHLRTVAVLRERLGDERYRQLYDEGAALSLDGAVALALSDPEPG
jgi:predicted ATPase/DNA-binding SARP family transcriptional activator